MVLRDAVGDLLEEDRLPRSGRGHDEAALPLPEGGDQVYDAHGDLVAGGLQVEPLVGKQGGQVVEEDLVLDQLGILEVDRLDLEKGEIPLALFRRPDLSRHRVPGAEIESPDLGGGGVD